MQCLEVVLDQPRGLAVDAHTLKYRTSGFLRWLFTVLANQDLNG